ncbi:hypothetical protein ACFT1A_19355 [Rhodococcus sp. NPDC057135]|uniref:hypothetical protein n=1 Tax=Rhodococcus sp. NPDC057135 TaxID=3346028 RepID=UPI003630E72E
MRRTGISAVMVVAVIALASCAVLDRDGRQATEAPAAQRSAISNSSSADAGGSQAVASVDGVEIRASASAGDSRRHLTISEGHATIPEAAARVASTKVVSVQMDAGKTQPSAPVRVEFDLSDRPDLVAKFTDGVVAVVETVSESDPNEFDMFIAQWNPETKSITADLTHLTGVWASFVDPKVLKAGVQRVFEKVRGNSNSQCRERSEVTLDGIEYTLTAVSPGAVAGCLVNSGGALAVDFENATGSFYTIVVAPDTAGGVWTNSGALSISDSAGALASSVTLGSKGVLVGRSGGRLVVNEGIDQFDVRLWPQQQGILTKSLLSGISMLGLDLKQLESITGAWDCIATATNATQIDSSFSPGDLYTMITDVSQCVVTQVSLQSGDRARSAALHRLSSAVEVFSLFQQLMDFTAGSVQAIARDSVKDFRIRSTASSSASSTAATPQAPAPVVVDRIELKTWAYDRVEGNTYVADNTGKKNLTVHVNSFAGDKDVRAGCQTTVTVTGPGLSQTETTDSCFVGNPGIGFVAPSPGEYLVAATVAQQGRADITSQVVVNVISRAPR